MIEFLKEKKTNNYEKLTNDPLLKSSISYFKSEDLFFIQNIFSR